MNTLVKNFRPKGLIYKKFVRRKGTKIESTL